MIERMWLVGQAPSADGKSQFQGRSGRSLAAWAAVPHEFFHRIFTCANLLDEHPGKNGKGDKFPMTEARKSAQEMLDEVFNPLDYVICVGTRVAQAFGIDTDERQPFVWFPYRDYTFAWMPHPSGVNLFYNETKNVITAQAFLTGAARL